MAKDLDWNIPPAINNNTHCFFPSSAPWVREKNADESICNLLNMVVGDVYLYTSILVLIAGGEGYSTLTASLTT